MAMSAAALGYGSIHVHVITRLLDIAVRSKSHAECSQVLTFSNRSVTLRTLTNTGPGHLHRGQAKWSKQLSFDTSLITLMYHILIRFWGLTLLQALRDLPAGCNRGDLEWASIAKCLQIHNRIRKGVFLGECFSNYFLLNKLLKVREGPRSSLI